MLDDLLIRDDVTYFIKQIKTNERYYKKGAIPNYPLYISDEIALYIFYDALIKYKIVLDDIYLFDEFLEQLEKLYKKLDNFESIRVGINKLIGKMVSLKLSINNVNDDFEKKQIVSYIYNRYIVDGYYIHGFNTSYEDKIKVEGFNPEKYDNYYEEFKKLNEVFAKYNVINIVEKDFSNNKTYFTDDVIMACAYSNYAPLFFYNLLTNKDYLGKRIRKEQYLIDDYTVWTRRLKRLMRDLSFSVEDEKFVNELLVKQWNLMHRKDKKISLLFVKKSRIQNECCSDFNEYLSDEDTYEIVDKILSSKNGCIVCNKKLEPDEIFITSFDTFYDKKSNILIESNLDDEYFKYMEEDVGREFLDVYGNASLFIILGSLFISLGVIVSIFMILGGIQ